MADEKETPKPLVPEAVVRSLHKMADLSYVMYQRYTTLGLTHAQAIDMVGVTLRSTADVHGVAAALLAGKTGG